MNPDADQMNSGTSREDPRSVRAGAASRKYLTFFLAEEEYALEILAVREIIQRQAITSVPNARHCVLGVINLRGRVVAVIDLRRRLGMDQAGDHAEACIIVLEGQTALRGVLVDRVGEVVDIAPEEIQAPPAGALEEGGDWLLGMVRCPSGLRLLLDLDSVLSELGAEETERLEARLFELP